MPSTLAGYDYPPDYDHSQISITDLASGIVRIISFDGDNHKLEADIVYRKLKYCYE